MKPIPQFTRQEIYHILIITAFVLVMTGLPYAYGYFSAPANQEFMGIAFSTPDTNQYLAWMRAFTQAPVISNTLTAEPNESIFFNLLWWLLAQAVRWLDLSQIATFQLFRVLASLTFLLTVYYFCALFLEEPRRRKTAFLIIALGAGLGWLLVVGKYLTGRLVYPLDVYIVEPNSFLSIMAFPHFVQAAWLILVVFALTILGYERRQWRYPLVAGVMGLILGLTHAYDLLLIYAVLWSFTFIVWLRDGRSSHLVLYPAAITLISCPPAFYSVYITSAFPVWREVLAQFVNADAWTPDPFRLLIVMGVPFIMALLTFDGLVPLRKRSLRELFLKVWCGVNMFIIYFPVSYQIHYLSGWQVSIAILATLGLYRRIVPWAQEQTWIRRLPAIDLSRVVTALFILAVVPTNIYLLAWRFVDLGRHQHPYYLYRDEVEALHWLEANTLPEEIVLSGMDVGQYIPSVAGNRAFLAHWAMTADVYNKQEMVQSFFNPTTPDEERRSILQQYDVRYVVYGAQERELGQPPFNTIPYLEEVFSAPGATVYRVDFERSVADG